MNHFGLEKSELWSKWKERCIVVDNLIPVKINERNDAYSSSNGKWNLNLKHNKFVRCFWDLPDELLKCDNEHAKKKNKYNGNILENWLKRGMAQPHHNLKFANFCFCWKDKNAMEKKNFNMISVFVFFFLHVSFFFRLVLHYFLNGEGEKESKTTENIQNGNKQNQKCRSLNWFIWHSWLFLSLHLHCRYTQNKEKNAWNWRWRQRWRRRRGRRPYHSSPISKKILRFSLFLFFFLALCLPTHTYTQFNASQSVSVCMLRVCDQFT